MSEHEQLFDAIRAQDYLMSAERRLNLVAGGCND
jgi:hypothetical protein